LGREDSSQIPHAVDLNHCRGRIVAILPAFLPVDRLAQLVNIGTLLAFYHRLRRCVDSARAPPDLHRPFKTRCSTGAILGIVTAVYLMTNCR